MSIFKTKGIILKIHKTKPGDFLYTIFTKEYGKIICNKKINKKEKTLDLGYLINFEIITKEHQKIHKIKSIKILSQFSNNNKTFNELNNYLILLALINEKSPQGLVIVELFELIELINNSNINEITLIILKLKIISIFGELNENHNNKVITKILKFINSNKVNRLLKLTGITEELKKELELI